MTDKLPVPMPWPPVDVAVAADLSTADPLALLEEAHSAAQAGVDWLHVDIMDGHLAPCIGLSPNISTGLVTRQPLPVSTHLLCDQPLQFAPHLADRGVSLVIIPAEATRHPRAIAEKIRASGGARVGISLLAHSPVEMLRGVLDAFDLVLLLAFEPGWPRQPLPPKLIETVRELDTMIRTGGFSCVLGVQGDIGPRDAKPLVEAGARLLIVGHQIFEQEHRAEQVDSIRQRARAGLDVQTGHDG